MGKLLGILASIVGSLAGAALWYAQQMSDHIRGLNRPAGSRR